MKFGERLRRQPTRGFTLIEVLVAIAILATVFMTMFAIYTHTLIKVRRAKNRTLATNTAKMMMEMIISSPYDASIYHGLTTITTLSADHPVQADLLHWKATLETFPTMAVGIISALDSRECVQDRCTDIVTVNVAIRYQDYGGETTNALSVKLEKRQ